jgi:hypothetical protein
MRHPASPSWERLDFDHLQFACTVCYTTPDAALLIITQGLLSLPEWTATAP